MKIAVIGRIESKKNKKPFDKNYYLSSYFQKILEKLNILWIPIVSEQFSEEICEMCDGLIVTGSCNDVHPKYYQEEVLEGKKYQYDEFPMVKKAIELFEKNKKPILGICAGIQEINVVFGGTLNQSIPSHQLKDGSKHQIEIEENSILYPVYHKKNMKVNSFHSQSIKKVALGFKVIAVSSDGVIEAIEKEKILGVQWHPEVVNDQKLFDKFIDICKESSDKNEV